MIIGGFICGVFVWNFYENIKFLGVEKEIFTIFLEDVKFELIVWGLWNLKQFWNNQKWVTENY